MSAEQAPRGGEVIGAGHDGDPAHRAELLEAALEERERLLGVAVHEIRTPLASLRLYLDALIKAADRGTLDPTEAGIRLRKAQRQCDRLNVLLGNLMDVSRAPSHELTVMLEPVDLIATVVGVCGRLRDQFTHQGRTLEVVAPAGSLIGNWDKARLEQIVNNLITNVYKHAPGASAKVTIASIEKGRVLMTVSDDGPGLKPEARQRLFERVTQSAPARTGMGLGLWIVAQIVHALGGTIRLDSAADRGASFAIELPQQRSAESAAPVARPVHG
jgi:signal transduction histidine kinase